MYRIRDSGWLEVISGPMYSSKTTELIHRIEKVKIANQDYKIFKPEIDDRYSENKISTHSGIELKAIPVEKAEDILEYVYEELDVVAIDECQFYDDKLPEIIDRLLDKHIRVIVTGLDMDFRGKPFELTSILLAKAEFITKLNGVCNICGELGTKTQRYVNGEPAHVNDPTIVVGGTENYSCVCRQHHRVKKD